jgi:hypothetical protein
MSTIANDTFATIMAPTSTMSLTAARLAFAGGATSLALLAALHVLRRDLEPSWDWHSPRSFRWTRSR